MARDIEEIKDRIAGCLWGQAIGDALGLGTEFMSRDEVLHNYPEGLSEYSQIVQDFHRERWSQGDWTDDTDMMLCIAMAVIADKAIKPKTVAHNFKEYFRGIPMGIGQLTYTVLRLYDYESAPEKAAEIVWDSMYGRNNAANGGVMRTSVVGLWKCIGSSVVISEIINSQVWQGRELSFEELCKIGYRYDDRIGSYIMTGKVGALEDLKLDDEQTMGYTLKTMGCAIWCLFHVNGFKEGMLKVVNAGGDADTNAAVACAVLGAKYGKKGIPEYYMQNLKRKDEYEEMIRQLTDILIEKFM